MGGKGPVLAVVGALFLFAWSKGTFEAQYTPEVAGGSASSCVAGVLAAAEDAGVGERGAVIGVAVTLVEGGRVLANPAVPDSFAYPHEGVGYDHDSVGCFQQRDNGAWGATADRMDPYSSAAMFFDRLTEIPGWEQRDPGSVAQQVQRSAYPGRYSARMDEAQAIVAGRGD